MYSKCIHRRKHVLQWYKIQLSTHIPGWNFTWTLIKRPRGHGTLLDNVPREISWKWWFLNANWHPYLSCLIIPIFSVKCCFFHFFPIWVTISATVVKIPTFVGKPPISAGKTLYIHIYIYTYIHIYIYTYIRDPWTRTCERYPGVDKSYLIMRRTPPGQVPAHQVSVWKQKLCLFFLICWKVLIFTRI